MHNPKIRLLLLALAAALFNLLPCLVARQGGDVFFHYAMIDCFGKQLWQGDFYVRWCMDDNAGLGSAAPMFYFPLGYYIAALLYPLHHLGLGVEQLYICAIYLANVATFLTCRFWLADMAGSRRAAMGAFLLLWMPYRMEVMVFRNAYAELWAIAFLPLLFVSVRRLLTQPQPRWVPVAFSTALCMLSHVPLTAIALMGCGIYSLVLNGWRWQRWRMLGLAVLVGLMLSAPYFLPAWHFLDTISPPAPDEPPVWFNGYIKLAHFAQGGAGILIASAIMIACGAIWAFQCFQRRNAIADSFIGRELIAWTAIALAGLFFSFEISAPVLHLFHGISAIIAPWRMRVLVMFAAIVFFAVKSQWLRFRKNWKMDYAVLCGFFMLLGFSVISARVGAPGDVERTALKAHIVTTWEEGRMRWVDAAHLSAAAIVAEYDRKELDRAVIAEGGGRIDIRRWDWKAIELSVQLNANGIVRLKQFYFPIWQAAVDGKPAELYPQPHTGLMLVRVPAGAHVIRLYRDLSHAAPLTMRMAWGSSLIALLLLLGGFVVDRRGRKS